MQESTSPAGCAAPKLLPQATIAQLGHSPACLARLYVLLVQEATTAQPHWPSSTAVTWAVVDTSTNNPSALLSANAVQENPQHLVEDLIAVCMDFG